METLRHPESTGSEGKYRISLKHFPGRFSELPLKVVYAIEDKEFIASGYPLKKAFQDAAMKVEYDKEVDAAYIELQDKKPEGAVEIDEGVILHLTKENAIVAIEILNAASRLPVENLYSLQVVGVT